MTRTLVTGAGGFVGANLVRRLAAGGDPPLALVRPGSGRWRLDPLGDAVEVVEADLRDGDATAALIAARRPERVFHLAAHGAYSTQRDVGRIFETNLLATAGLLDACLEAGVEAFVNSGSSSEYGLKDHAPREDEALHPNSAYAVGKAAASMYCAQRAAETGARVVTLRLYSAYGPWEEPSRLIPTLVLAGLDGRLPPLVDPRIARDFVHVDDVVDAYLAAAEAGRPGAAYNVGTGVQTTLADAVAVARELLGVSARPEWGSMPDRDWDTTTWVADPALIAAELGWAPRHDFRGGLAATIEWFRDPPHRAHYESRPA
ncbi:MAG TPA: NAD-dependent epimerase/dehydratase family protein [Solirubrobacterales bacterium]|nr:NAD-dependent epimerase/dehydratase family protein [Solirubrobacterales bacterium]